MPIPIAPGAKHPPRGFDLDALFDRLERGERPSEEEIRSWWERWADAQVGLITGAATELIVLDVDGEDVELPGGVPLTPAVKTAKGRHFYFRWAGPKLPSLLKIADWIEVRGDRGYVVAPPSKHPLGARYEWLIAPGEEELKEPPEWLYQAILERVQPPSRDASKELPAKIPEGWRNVALTSLAGTLRRRGLTAEEIESALLAVNASRCEPPLPEEEVRQIARSVARYEPAEPLDDPLAGVALPPGYALTDRALVARGERGEVPIAPRALWLSGQFRDEAGRLWLEVRWLDPHAEGGVASRIVPREEVFDAQKLKALAAYGAPVASSNVSALVRFLQAFEGANEAALAPKPATTRFGWLSDGAFQLGERTVGGKPVRFIPLGPEDERLARALRPKGDPEEGFRLWRELWEALPTPASRLFVAAGLAAPLLKPLGERSMLVHSWGESGTGKTAELHLALAAWGDPNELKSTSFATLVGVERLATLLSDLPLALDERQAASSETLLAVLPYVLSGGVGKLRGAREGGLQALAHWRTVALTTGEEELSEAPWTGVRNRVLALYVPPQGGLPERLARRIYKELPEAHGHVAPRVLERAIALGPERLREAARHVEKALEGVDLPASHRRLISLITVARVLLENALRIAPLDRPPEAALAEARQLAEELAAGGEEGYARRALELILGEVHSFRAEVLRCGGQTALEDEERVFEADGHLYIAASLFSRWCKRLGLSERRVLADWNSNNWILTSQRAGKTRLKMERRTSGGRAWFVVLRPEAWNSAEEEEES